MNRESDTTLPCRRREQFSCRRVWYGFLAATLVAVQLLVGPTPVFLVVLLLVVATFRRDRVVDSQTTRRGRIAAQLLFVGIDIFIGLFVLAMVYSFIQPLYCGHMRRHRL